MTNEPVALAGAVTAAITATVGILTITEVLDADVAGAIITALTAWVGVATAWARSKVSPVGS
jgi:hypothetical protein